MDEIREILMAHCRKYPNMHYQDAVKLLYQSEFGGGHMIRDEESCLNFLRREYAATPQDPRLPLTEDIGNGFVRVYLGALDAHGWTPEKLDRMFLRGAAHPWGSMERFEKKLQLLEALTQEGLLPFLPDSLAVFLGEYRAAECPMLSHSEIYRAHYHPAYRVVPVHCLNEE